MDPRKILNFRMTQMALKEVMFRNAGKYSWAGLSAGKGWQLWRFNQMSPFPVPRVNNMASKY